MSVPEPMYGRKMEKFVKKFFATIMVVPFITKRIDTGRERFAD